MVELTEHTIEIDGQRLAYVSDGPADKTAVFIHGNSSCKSAFKEQVSALLEAGYGLLAIDLPGHGASDDAAHPETDYTIPAYAKTINALSNKLQLHRPVLCGWSLGGHIAIEIAGSGADISGLLICGTPPVGPGIEHAEKAFLPSDVGDVTGAEAPPTHRLDAYIDAVYGTLSPVPDKLRRAGHRADGRSRASMFNHWISGVSGHSQRDVVQNWRSPLLIVHGAEDAFVPADYFQTLDMPGDGAGTVFEVIENAGHAPFLEAPETFNRLLLEFCARCFSSQGDSG